VIILARRSPKASSGGDLQAFLAQLPSPAFTINKQGRIGAVNAEAAKLVGREPPALRAVAAAELFAPEDRPRVESLCGTARSGGPVQEERVRLRLPSGESQPVALSLKAFPSRPRGAILALLRSPRLTESAHESDLDLHRRIRAIFESVIEPIVAINERGIIEALNPAVERQFGYTAEELIGQNVSLLMPEPYASDHDRYIRRYLESGEAHIIGIGREAEAKRKDGTTFPIYLSVSESRMEGGRRIFTGFIQDLTERKEHERQAAAWTRELERRVQQRTAELTATNQELEHFSYAISHDLRAPVRGIRNYVDFLVEDLGGQVSGETAEDLERLGRAARELDQMINELLDFSRIGRTEATPEAIDAAQLLDDIRRAAAPGPDRQVIVRGELPRLRLPLGLVRQIFTNLIENGLTYNTSSTPRVEITARRLDAQEPPVWEFAFSDNGIGIEPEYHDQIFQIFQRLHKKQDYPGTGIGLAAVRKAVGYIGGSIRLTSEPGRGSTFYVQVPENFVIEPRGDGPEGT